MPVSICQIKKSGCCSSTHEWQLSLILLATLTPGHYHHPAVEYLTVPPLWLHVVMALRTCPTTSSGWRCAGDTVTTYLDRSGMHTNGSHVNKSNQKCCWDGGASVLSPEGAPKHYRDDNNKRTTLHCHWKQLWYYCWQQERNFNHQHH